MSAEPGNPSALQEVSTMYRTVSNSMSHPWQQLAKAQISQKALAPRAVIDHSLRKKQSPLSPQRRTVMIRFSLASPLLASLRIVQEILLGPR
jgi:hypothetical protein